MTNDLQTAYAEEAERFYGDVSHYEGEYLTSVAGGNTDLDKMATDDDEGDPLLPTLKPEMTTCLNLWWLELTMKGDLFVPSWRRGVAVYKHATANSMNMRFTPYTSACWSCKR